MQPGGPLAGIKVLAVEQSVAGPLCSRILGDMGADVVKVENAKDGDFARHWDGHVKGEASHFTWLARRKRSIALNLKDAEEREIFERLLARADVLISNMSSAAAHRLGFTKEKLGGSHPTLIACQISGYGPTGPFRDRKAYDMLVQAETGLMALTGDDAPTRVGVSIADIGTGIYAAALILGALFEREHTGRGRAFDLTMFETMSEFAGPNLTAFANGGVLYERNPRRHHSIVPYGVFEASDGALVIAIEQDAEWVVFSRDVLERPDLCAERYATNAARLSLRREVEAEVEAAMRTRSRADWLARLEAARLAYASINNIDAVWNHPVAKHLGLHREVTLPDSSPALVPTSPSERIFGRDQGQAHIPGLNADKVAILAELDAERP